MKWIRPSDKLPNPAEEVLVFVRTQDKRSIFSVARLHDNYIKEVDDSSENKSTWVFDKCELNGLGKSSKVVVWTSLLDIFPFFNPTVGTDEDIVPKYRLFSSDSFNMSSCEFNKRMWPEEGCKSKSPFRMRCECDGK